MFHSKIPSSFVLGQGLDDTGNKYIHGDHFDLLTVSVKLQQSLSNTLKHVDISKYMHKIICEVCQQIQHEQNFLLKVTL